MGAAIGPIIAAIGGLAGTGAEIGMGIAGSNKKEEAMREAAARMEAYRGEMQGARTRALQNMLPLFNGLGSEMNRRYGAGTFSQAPLRGAAQNPFAAGVQRGPIGPPPRPAGMPGRVK